MTTTIDYYALLGVDPDATLAQIKKAYRTLARQHHPDTNPGDPQAAARFRNLTEAYDTLSDPKRREAYDRTRPKTKATTAGSTLAEPGPGSRAASLLVQVLEDTWLAIRRRRRHHPGQRHRNPPAPLGTLRHRPLVRRPR
jgi:curved DNA-binding protein CbpA